MYEKIFAYNTSLKSIWNSDKQHLKLNKCFNIFQLIRPENENIEIFEKTKVIPEVYELYFTVIFENEYEDYHDLFVNNCDYNTLQTLDEASQESGNHQKFKLANFFEKHEAEKRNLINLR